MAWQKFRDYFMKHTIDESHFVLGLDLGSAMSSLAYFDTLRQCPEIVDMSGGYGKPSTPTVLQYAPDTKEWVFGEYAVLNRGFGREQTYTSLVERLGRNEYIEVDGKPMTIAYALGLYCKELVATCKSLNPKAEIVGIVMAVPSYINEETRAEYMAAFRAAGLERDAIALVPDRECVFRHYIGGLESAKAERLLLLDFGSRALRGGIYDVQPTAGGASFDSISSLFDESLGTQQINDAVAAWFTDFYCTQTKTEKTALTKQTLEQLSIFTYQHKDLLFQKEIGARPIKLYYNFAYPPMQQTVSADAANALLQPFMQKTEVFLREVFTKTQNTNVPAAQVTVDTVLCTGGGFEMLWVRRMVQSAFPNSRVVFYKNAKGIMAEGASIMAADALGIIKPRRIAVIDKHMLASDIGVKTRQGKQERFVPIIERNSFWWQAHKPMYFLLNEPTGAQDVTIELFTRDGAGEVRPLGAAVLAGLPERPSGTTKLKLSLQCSAYNALTAIVTDAGFGELFPASDFEKTYAFAL